MKEKLSLGVKINCLIERISLSDRYWYVGHYIYTVGKHKQAILSVPVQRVGSKIKKNVLSGTARPKYNVAVLSRP